jgi:hypothetical protein
MNNQNPMLSNDALEVAFGALNKVSTVSSELKEHIKNQELTISQLEQSMDNLLRSLSGQLKDCEHPFSCSCPMELALKTLRESQERKGL